MSQEGNGHGPEEGLHAAGLLRPGGLGDAVPVLSFELGEHFVRFQIGGTPNLVVGIEKGFPNERYIRHDSLEDTCAAVA